MIGKRVMKRLLKKDHNHSVFNYRPGSLLLKMFQSFSKARIWRNFSIYGSTQSGFKPSDSCVNQLISTTDAK